MARARNRRPAARRNPRRLDAASGQERGDAAVWRDLAKMWRQTIKINHGIGIDLDIRKAADIAVLCDEPMVTDTRIALRRKLNGDSR